jgi:hypothetical protein
MKSAATRPAARAPKQPPCPPATRSPPCTSTSRPWTLDLVDRQPLRGAGCWPEAMAVEHVVRARFARVGAPTIRPCRLKRVSSPAKLRAGGNPRRWRATCQRRGLLCTEDPIFRPPVRAGLRASRPSGPAVGSARSACRVPEPVITLGHPLGGVLARPRCAARPPPAGVQLHHGRHHCVGNFREPHGKPPGTPRPPPPHPARPPDPPWRARRPGTAPRAASLCRCATMPRCSGGPWRTRKSSPTTPSSESPTASPPSTAPRRPARRPRQDAFRTWSGGGSARVLRSAPSTTVRSRHGELAGRP